MTITYLGTGASEGIPGTFCTCPVCQTAREKKGKHIRRRTSVLLNGDTLFDLTADFWEQSRTFDADSTKITNVFLSNNKFERFYAEELQNLARPYAIEGAPETVNVFGEEGTEERFMHTVSDRRRAALEGKLIFHTLTPFEPVTVGETTITPFSARHATGAFGFLVEEQKGQEHQETSKTSKTSKNVLICNDGGYFPEETWDFLAKKKIDLISLDCNNPFNSDTINHMSVEDVITTRRRLFQLGCITKAVPVLITHISHNSGVTHDETQEHMTTYGITVSYDGMTVHVQ